MQFEWQKEYSVNIEEIDDQHKAFIGIMNDLHDSINKEKDSKVLNDIFAELVDYAKFHFKTEESYFDKFGYPESAEHKQAHKDLLEKIENMMSMKSDHAVKISFELLDFLEDWLVDHLADMDKKYSTFFNERGLA